MKDLQDSRRVGSSEGRPLTRESLATLTAACGELLASPTTQSLASPAEDLPYEYLDVSLGRRRVRPLFTADASAVGKADKERGVAQQLEQAAALLQGAQDALSAAIAAAQQSGWSAGRIAEQIDPRRSQCTSTERL